jgi:peptidoglycan/LPS O-acetylase OafA/YrhL
VIYTTQLPGTLDEFGVGIALALIGQQPSKHCAGAAAGAQLAQLPGVAGVFSAVFDAGGCHIFANRKLLVSLWMVVFWRTLLAVGFGGALAAMITCPIKASGFLKPWRYLGTISYGLYLWHFPVLLSLLTLPGPRRTQTVCGVAQCERRFG